VSTNKNELRLQLRAKRNALTPDDQRRAALHLARNVSRLRLFRSARHIACYLPVDGEINTAPLVTYIRRLRKTCYLPVLSHQRNARLWFAPYIESTELAPNRLGILEPVVSPNELVRASALDLILMPLVGFDDHGHRLGMGGGYFDRSLEYRRHRQRWLKPHLLGVAHDIQRTASLTADPWDIPLQGVITDQNVYLYN